MKRGGLALAHPNTKGETMKFTHYIEVPIDIEYEYEDPEPDVGFAGGIHVNWTIPDLRDIDFEAIAQEHYDRWCEEEEAARLDYYDAMRETQLILDKWNKEEGR